MKYITLLVLFNLSFNLGLSQCIYDEILQVGSEICYPSVAFENGIQISFSYHLETNDFEYDERNEPIYRMFDKQLDTFQQVITNVECGNEELPRIIVIDFKLSTSDSTYFLDSTLTIQRTSLWDIKNPVKEAIEIFQKSKWKIKGTNNFISKGRNTVFKYIYSYSENPYLYDDEKYEIFYFEIQKGTTEFEYKNNELLKIGLFQYTYRHEGQKYLKSIDKGYVSGKLIEGVWYLNIRIADFDYAGEAVVSKPIDKKIKQNMWD